jgi:hypothetical protein
MKDFLTQIRYYRQNYAILARAHYIASDRLDCLNMWLGVPALLISIAICSTLFASSSQAFSKWVITFAGFASLGVTMLTGLQVFLRASERSMEHRSAGARFADIRRRFEIMHLKYNDAPPEKLSEGIKELEILLRELRELGSLCPKVPDRHYKNAEADYDLGDKANEYNQNQSNRMNLLKSTISLESSIMHTNNQ